MPCPQTPSASWGVGFRGLSVKTGMLSITHGSAPFVYPFLWQRSPSLLVSPLCHVIYSFFPITELTTQL